MNNKHNNPQSQDTFSGFETLLDQLHIEAGNPKPYQPPKLETEPDGLGLDGLPVHADLLNLKKVQVKIFDNAGKTGEVSFNHVPAYEFANFDWIFRLRSHSISISIELPIAIREWPRDCQGRPELIGRALGLDSNVSIPPPNFLILSRPDREPPKADLIYLLKDPVYFRKVEDFKARNFFLDLQMILCRKLGGAWIGDKGFAYNPYCSIFRTDPLESARLRVLRHDLWPMVDLVNLAKKMPDCNRVGRDESIVELCKSGRESYQKIADRFGISFQRVYQIARQNGIEAKPSISTQKKQIRQMRASGKSVQEIASQFGCHRTRINQILKSKRPASL